MPTWREWIADEDERLYKYEGTVEIRKTSYFVNWVEFIRDPELKAISTEYTSPFFLL